MTTLGIPVPASPLTLQDVFDRAWQAFVVKRHYRGFSSVFYGVEYCGLAAAFAELCAMQFIHVHFVERNLREFAARHGLVVPGEK